MSRSASSVSKGSFGAGEARDLQFHQPLFSKADHLVQTSASGVFSISV